MRIAQLAPLAESVPPKLYGGTGRVVAWLVDELSRAWPRCSDELSIGAFVLPRHPVRR